MPKSQKSAQSLFVEKAKAKHGDKYDYSQANYLTAKKKLAIICGEHGVFLQTPSDHLSGCGCPLCGVAKRRLSQSLSTDTFIERAKNIVGDRYDYSQVAYLGLRTKVKIICPEHGAFEMTPGTHLKNRHCPKCTGRAFVPTDEFVQKAKTVHKDKYDYSLVNCQHNRQAVKIVCRIHGVFEQEPRSHLLGSGCERCASIERGAKKSSTAADHFIEKARKIHGNLYDYSKALYKRNNANLTIGCAEHGYFKQTPANHLIGRGCPSCSKTGFDPTKPAILYYLSINNGQAYKIGITNRTIEERFTNEDLSKISVVASWHFDVGEEARLREAEILNLYLTRRYKGADLLLNGNSELFDSDVLELEGKTETLDILASLRDLLMPLFRY